MKITFEDFVKACPSAMSPSPSIFESISDLIESRVSLCRNIVTPTVFDRLDDVDAFFGQPDYERYCSLLHHVKSYICTSAYHLAIPQLDLVLTPTGFGVVSNQNLAPASAERVRELRSQVHVLECLHLDEMISLLRPMVDWSKSSYGHYFFETLFWRGEHVRKLGYPNPTRDDLVTEWPAIASAAREIMKVISPELYRTLLRVESTDSADVLEQSLIDLCRAATVAIIRESGSWPLHREILLRFLDDHVDDFPDYRDSSTFKANHFEHYENKKDDTCFFFG